MNLGTIFTIVETVIANAPKAWAIIKQGVASVEAATDVKSKLAAIGQFLADAAQEIGNVVAGL